MFFEVIRTTLCRSYHLITPVHGSWLTEWRVFFVRRVVSLALEWSAKTVFR